MADADGGTAAQSPVRLPTFLRGGCKRLAGLRVMFRIVMLHSFVKKTQKTPPNERRIAERRLKEIKNVA